MVDRFQQEVVDRHPEMVVILADMVCRYASGDRRRDRGPGDCSRSS